MSHKLAQAPPWAHINEEAKREAIRLLAMGLSARRVAERLGRDVRTMYDWAQNDPAFARALNVLASEKDDEAIQYQRRLRRMADTLLDEIEAMATDRTNTPAVVRKDVLKTFFADVHNPAVLPKVPASQAPFVVVNAEQAALLFAPSNGGEHANQPSQGASNGGDARAVSGQGAGPVEVANGAVPASTVGADAGSGSGEAAPSNTQSDVKPAVGPSAPGV